MHDQPLSDARLREIADYKTRPVIGDDETIRMAEELLEARGLGLALPDVLPCPFCGSTTHTVGAPTPAERPRVTCGDCGARGALARSGEHLEAIANWNRRPAPR